MALLFLILLLVSPPAQSAEATEVFSYLYSGKTINVRVGEVSKVKVNDICLNDQAKCEALKAFRGPSQLSKHKGSSQGNFAGAYCELLKGTQLFAHKNGEENIQFCVFKDLTFIEAKALYRKHAKARGGKK